MISENTKANRKGYNVAVRCKVTQAQMLCLILFSGGCVQQCLTPLGKLGEE